MHLNSSDGYNRFWMRLFATPDEKVYGCGEQASYFNLRNRNYPLWTSEPGVGRDKQSLTTFYADLKDKAGNETITNVVIPIKIKAIDIIILIGILIIIFVAALLFKRFQMTK